MGHGDEAKRVLLGQVKEASHDLRNDQHAGTCPSHHPLAKGVRVLLECEAARLTAPDSPPQEASQSRTPYTVGGLGAGAAILALLEAFFRAHGWI